MFVYDKKLQYPVKIDKPNPRLASIIISQYGGPDGELGASLRYLSQRYSMPFDELKGLLTDVGTEELGHLEMIGAIVHQLTRNLKDSQIQDSAFAPYFVDHTAGVYPTAASGAPWSAFSMQVKGDPITDLTEDLAAEAALYHTAIGFCHFLANRKVVAAQGFLGSVVGEPSYGLSKSICGVVVRVARLVDSIGCSPAALCHTK